MKNIVLQIIIFVFICSCSIQKNINFLNYPIDDFEGIVSTKYEGVYRNFDFKFLNGSTLFYLIPKENANQLYLINGKNDSDYEDILLNNLIKCLL